MLPLWDTIPFNVFTLSRSVVSSKTTLQSTVALSTTEVEYMAATEVVKEAIWLRSRWSRFATEVNYCVLRQPECYTYNQKSNVSWEGQTYWCHGSFCCWQFYRSTEDSYSVENPADMVTKPIPVVKFKLWTRTNSEKNLWFGGFAQIFTKVENCWIGVNVSH